MNNERDRRSCAIEIPEKIPRDGDFHKSGTGRDRYPNAIVDL